MDIIKLPIEHRAETVDSRFRLVLMAAQRARQISDGSEVLVKSKYVKNTTLALEEAIEGQLKYVIGEQARKAKDLEFSQRRERMARRSMEESAEASIERMDDIKISYKAEAVEEEPWDDEAADDDADLGPEEDFVSSDEDDS